MNFKHILMATCLGTALLSMTTSCNMTQEEKERIARKAAGKDDFRDSEKWGKVVTRTLELEDFCSIVRHGNADIKVKQGEECRVKVTGNEKALEAYSISIGPGGTGGASNPTLYVSMDEEKFGQVPSIKVSVTMPRIMNITMDSGNGDIEFKGNFDNNIYGSDYGIGIEMWDDGDLEANTLKTGTFFLNIYGGSGDVRIKKVESNMVRISTTSEGDINTDIQAKDIDVEINGAGDADLDVKCQNLTVTASGTGEIELKGECAHLTKQSSGLASIDSRKLAIHKKVVIQ